MNCGLDDTGALCAACGVPLVVRPAGADLSHAEHVELITALDELAERQFPDQEWQLEERRDRGGWHGHAWPVHGGHGQLFRAMRPHLRRIARRPRPDPRQGWRRWGVTMAGRLHTEVSDEDWTGRRLVAECRGYWLPIPERRVAPRPRCTTSPGADCTCGVNVFAALSDAEVFYAPVGPGPAAGLGAAWGLVRTDGPQYPKLIWAAATWRCAAAELEALVIGRSVAQYQSRMARGYEVPVHVARDDSVAGLVAAAASAGLPAVTRR